MFSHCEETCSDYQSNPRRYTHPVYLNVVQLLLPLQDVFHAVHPDINVSHQHRLAHVLHQTAK